MSSSASAGDSPSTTEMPRLERTMISFWSSRSGSRSDSRTRSAVSAASCALTTSSSRIANSSPPKRAAVSLARMLVARRSATSRRTSSPAAWPRLSLIVLKSSRSRKMTAMPLLLATVARDGVAHALDEQRAVGQVGDRVVEGLVGELLLEGLALADVAAVEDDPADGVVLEQVRVQDLELAQRPVAVAQRALEDLGLAAGVRRAVGQQVQQAALLVGVQEAIEARADHVLRRRSRGRARSTGSGRRSWRRRRAR